MAKNDSSQNGHQTGNNCKKTTELLVSVRDLAETETALTLGVDWIDLKDPAAGPLGAPGILVARQVAMRLADHPHRSVALGELEDLEPDLAIQLATLFPVLKIGLSNQHGQSEWQRRLSILGGIFAQQRATLVPVIYADWRHCNAPPPAEVVEHARQSSSAYVLFDTYEKRGKRLLDWMTVEEIASHVRELSQCNCRVVLAGSIVESDLVNLANVPCAAFGIRGAVCRSGRDSEICSDKLSSWVARVAAL